MKVLIVTLALFSSSVFAALPPYWDSVKQIAVVIEAVEVSQALQNSPILNIGAGKVAGSWTVMSERCSADVYLIAHTPGHPGPNTYTLDGVKNVICR